MQANVAADPLLARLSSVLSEKGAVFAYVFGSYGTRSFGPDSDIDVAVSFAPRKLTASEFLSLMADLEDVAGRRVDLSDLLRTDPILRMQVLRRGRPFFVRDAEALTEFRMKTPSLYYDVKISRRAVEEAHWDRGAPS
jgi:predicted nucleotidyltransferase